MQYTIRAVSKDLARAQTMLSKRKIEECGLFEVIFGRLNGRKAVTVSIPIPSHMIHEELYLYFVNGKNTLMQIDYTTLEDRLVFSTNKVGMYMVSRKEEHRSFTSTVVMASTSNFKQQAMIEDALLGM